MVGSEPTMLVQMMSLVLAAVPGVPETPPGPLPDVWISWGNDWFGVPQGPDNNRTNEMVFGLREGRCVVVFDDSMLTAYDDAAHLTGARQDEGTFTVGYMFDKLLTVGAGVRLRADLRGETVQLAWHKLIGSGYGESVPYDDASAVGAGYILSTWESGPDAALGSRCVLSALATTDGELDADLAVHTTWRINDACMWFGPRYQVRRAADATPVLDRVLRYEDGMWIDLGIRMGMESGVTFETRYATEQNEAVGTMTFAWRF